MSKISKKDKIILLKTIQDRLKDEFPFKFVDFPTVGGSFIYMNGPRNLITTIQICAKRVRVFYDLNVLFIKMGKGKRINDAALCGIREFIGDKEKCDE
jgi:hypothetical protein